MGVPSFAEAGSFLLIAAGGMAAVFLRRWRGEHDGPSKDRGRGTEAQDDFRVIYEDHPLPMWIFDPISRGFLSTNGAFRESYGYTEDDLLTMNVEQLWTTSDPGEAGEGSDEAAGRTAGRRSHVRKDGSSLSVELSERDIIFKGQAARFVLALDVTEREKLNTELFRRAQHDPLTGLANRQLLDERIEQCLERCLRERCKAVLFTIDADRFKLINDTYGHATGDEALKAIASRLRGRIRAVDTIARTGGEEFAAIIGGLHSFEDAEKVASMFVRLFDVPVTLPGHDLKLSISVGAAIFPDDASDAENLRKKSDQALYHAKRSGRNRYAFSSQEVCAQFDQALSVEAALREALRKDGLTLSFQPVFQENGRTAYFEALLRMSEQNGVVYHPSQFIPVAEESGLIVPIGEWVLEQAIEQLHRWKLQGMDRLRLAVNVSGKQLLQKGFVKFVSEALDERGLRASSLQLELTESSLMSDPALVRDSMVRLAARGVRFAIDDYGTGYSSLERLMDLPLSIIKIDRCFIRQMDKSRRADDVVTAIIQMAQMLRVEVVAEGVENESQYNLLLRRGCHLFQGFHLSRPLTAAEATSRLEHGTWELSDYAGSQRGRPPAARGLRLHAQLPARAGKGRV